MTLAIIRDDENYNWTRNNGVFSLKCKRCGYEIPSMVCDLSNYEIIYKTGFCRMCLIDLGYCS
jgi:uncharacterized ferredoxin-like protein